MDVRVMRLSQDWRLASSMGKKQLGSQQMLTSPWQRAPESSACEVRGAVVLFRCMAALAMVQDLLGRMAGRRWSGGWLVQVLSGVGSSGRGAATIKSTVPCGGGGSGRGLSVVGKERSRKPCEALELGIAQ